MRSLRHFRFLLFWSKLGNLAGILVKMVGKRGRSTTKRKGESSGTCKESKSKADGRSAKGKLAESREVSETTSARGGSSKATKGKKGSSKTSVRLVKYD
jgi:hypothetical protein